MFKKITLILVFAIIALAAVSFYVFQKKQLPRDVVSLEILGPTEVEMMEDAEYTVVYKNKGNVILENTTLFFEYPDGAIPAEGKSKIVQSDSGDLLPGQEKSMRFHARLMGEEKEAKTFRARLAYQPKGLRASFETTNTLTAVINAVPIFLEFDLPSKVRDGNLGFSIYWRSYSRYPLTNLNLQLEYPVNFAFDRSIPQGLTPDEWRIGLLNRGEGGRVDIQGLLRGGEFDQQIFRAKLVAFNEVEQKQVVVKEIVKGVEIVNPTIFISQWVNGKQGYVASPGEDLHFEIFFRNTSEVIQQDLSLAVELQSEALDFDSVRMPLGTFKKDTGMAIWEPRDLAELRILGPYKEGRVEFWAKVKDNFGDLRPDAKNLMITSKVALGEGQEEFRIPVNSKFIFDQRAYFAYKDTTTDGLVPPVAGTPTRYTIVWTFKNYFNDLANVKVRTTLPFYVKVISGMDGQGESKEIVWSLNNVSAGQGVFSQPLTLVFRVEVIPPLENIGKALMLVDKVKVEAEDAFTKSFLEKGYDALDSTMLQDKEHAGAVLPSPASKLNE